MVKHGTPRSASEVTGSRFMLRGAGTLGAKGLAGHPEAYECCSVAWRRADEVLEGGCGHRFTSGGLGHDLLGPTWAPHGRRRRARPWAEGVTWATMTKWCNVVQMVAQPSKSM